MDQQLIIQLKKKAFTKNSYNARFIEGKYEKLYPEYKDRHNERCTTEAWERYWEIRKLVLSDKDKITLAPSTCLLHKKPEKGNLCSDCDWLKFGYDFVKHKPGIRYTRRQAPMFMYQNLYQGKCWCGKTKEEFEPLQRKYCCANHGNIWYFRIECYWPSFRHMICMRDRGYCQECNIQVVQFYKGEELWDDCYFHGRDLLEWDADHIQALVLGGMCFDAKNVRTICKNCHKIKTKSDIGILAWWRRESNYDTGPMIPNNQRSLKEYVNFD